MLDFLLDHLLIIIIAAVALFVIIPIIKNIFSTAVTIIIVVVILGALGVFGTKFFENAKEPVMATKEFAQNTIQPTITKELENADFKYDPTTKKYNIISASFRLEGVADENRANVYFKEKKYTMDVTFLKTFIENKIEEQQTM